MPTGRNAGEHFPMLDIRKIGDFERAGSVAIFYALTI
jgi:hypothetical protein